MSHKNATARIDDDVLVDKTKMGRPVIYDKPLKRTFTIDYETEHILDRLATENRCSRSDALVMAVRGYALMKKSIG